MRSRFVALAGLSLVTGCLPRPQPAQPAPVAQPDPNAAPVATAQTAPAPAQPMPAPPPQPIASQQPQATAPQQPYPPPQQQPAPQQPYAPQAYPPPQPTQQSYPPQQQYPAPYGYSYPAPRPLAAPPSGRSHFHDGEVIGDFAAVGALASIDIMVRQDINNGSAGTFVLIAGIAGGGATGWLLTDRFPIDAGSAHATTIGLVVGIANGALLIEPTKWDDSDQVLGLLLLGSAVGAGAGFAYGQTAHLTAGQSYFVANMTLLGSATAAFGAIIGSNDGRFGGREDATLALGLDGGVVAGAVIAPSLDWSARRAKIVISSTAIGAFVGGMLAGLTTKSTQNGGSSDPNGDVVASCMAAGMWGGFGLGILMTRDDVPDDAFAHPAAAGAGAPSATSFAPWIGRDGQYGVLAGGSF